MGPLKRLRRKWRRETWDVQGIAFLTEREEVQLEQARVRNREGQRDWGKVDGKYSDFCSKSSGQSVEALSSGET